VSNPKNPAATSPDDPRPRLRVSHEEAAQSLDIQIGKADEFLPSGTQKVTRETLFNGRRVWSDYTTELLRQIFTTDGPAKEFERGQHFAVFMSASPAEQFENEVERTTRQVGALRSIRARLELFEGATKGQPTSIQANAQALQTIASRDVFVVHGRDEAAKLAVARFLEKLDLNPVILHEQPDKGRTVIENFEDHSADARFAVVLLTPDDEGCLVGGEVNRRARQNVVFELGYFIGKLGRNRVIALKLDSVEEPSDLHGVLYVPFDAGGAWKLVLARELKAANVDVDLNKVI
jgi:predicted nucleotide-binding protein